MPNLRIPEAAEFFATPGPQHDQVIEQMSNNDELWLASYIQQLDAFFVLFTQSELFLIRNTGHFVQLDKPNRVAALIANFLNERHEWENNTPDNSRDDD